MKTYTKPIVNDIFTFIHENYFSSSAFMDKTRYLDPEWKKRNHKWIENLIEQEEEMEDV